MIKPDTHHLVSMMPQVQSVKAKAPEAKIIELLQYADHHAIPRERWIRKWRDAPGTRSRVELWGSNLTVLVTQTGNYYHLGWNDYEGARPMHLTAMMTLEKDGRLTIHALERLYLPTKNAQAVAVSSLPEDRYAALLCEWLGL